MKRRLFALVLAGAMVLGNTFCVAAEETEAVTEAAAEEVVELTMDMLEEPAYEGAWLSFDGGFDLYLPSDWDVLEISEEDAAKDVVFQAVAADESGNNVAVSASEVGTECTLEAIAADLETAGFSDVTLMIINGIPAVSFETAVDTAVAYGIAFVDDAGIMYTVQVGAASENEESLAIAQNIFISLSPTEILETEAVTE